MTNTISTIYIRAITVTSSEVAQALVQRAPNIDGLVMTIETKPVKTEELSLNALGHAVLATWQAMEPNVTKDKLMYLPARIQGRVDTRFTEMTKVESTEYCVVFRLQGSDFNRVSDLTLYLESFQRQHQQPRSDEDRPE